MLCVLDPCRRENVASNRCALAIMTKAPVAGNVKTRLTPLLSPEEAAQLNVCFLRDLAMSISHACRMSPAVGVAVYTPVGAEAVYENILSEGFVLVPQRGENFGERLFFAAEDLFALGFSSVCLINSDSPAVPAANFAEAAIELANPGERIVLGPSEDGGYYLIGLKKMRRRLFKGIDWSTDRVLRQTKQRAVELGLPTHELAIGLDVDDQASLIRLHNEIFKHDQSTDIAPNTREFLRKVKL